MRTDRGCSIGETDCRQLQKIQQEERKEGRWKGGEKGGMVEWRGGEEGRKGGYILQY